VTERAGRRVTRIDPETGEKKLAVTIDEVLVGGQHEGLLGMALHPELLQGSGNDFVYVAYTYDADPAPGEAQVARRAKLVRFTYDPNAETLGQPSELIADIPAGTDHNAGRVKFGPDGMLYYATGDQGGNWLANYCNPIRAQVLPSADEISAKDWSTYTGKVLRLAPDGGIPSDNPAIDGVRSHIFSYGHRNPQGLVFGPDGALYSAEHGEKTDDEINLIEAGMNYGWPHVLGFQDDQAYTFGNWSAAANCSDLTFSAFSFPDAVPQQREADWSAPNFREPLKTLYTVHELTDRDFLGSVSTAAFAPLISGRRRRRPGGRAPGATAAWRGCPWRSGQGTGRGRRPAPRRTKARHPVRPSERRSAPGRSRRPDHAAPS
jgi:PQQ-dependent dehydrogenase (s-GDH family)